MISFSTYNPPPSQEQFLCAIRVKHNYGYAVTSERSESMEALLGQFATSANISKGGPTLSADRKPANAPGAAFAQAIHDT